MTRRIERDLIAAGEPVVRISPTSMAHVRDSARTMAIRSDASSPCRVTAVRRSPARIRQKKQSPLLVRLSELRLVITDPETIATRTDKQDPSTETSRAQRDAEALAAEQQDVLAAAHARVDELIG
jgi:hypothetical protein